MLFFQALLTLLVYDVLSTFCRFETIYSMVKSWDVASASPGQDTQDTIDRVCAAVNYACIWYPKQALCLQRSFLTTYLLRSCGIAAACACSMCCRKKASSAAMPRSKFKGHKELEIELKYHEGEPVIRELKRVSTPGRRVYSSVSDLKPHRQGLGVSILSTPQGVMTDTSAREKNVGGEVLCQVF